MRLWFALSLAYLTQTAIRAQSLVQSAATSTSAVPMQETAERRLIRLKTTLEFVAKTLKLSLEEHGGETFKSIQADSTVQDQLKAIASFVKSQLIEMEENNSTFVYSDEYHNIIRRRGSSSVLSSDVGMFSRDFHRSEVDTLDRNAHPIKQALGFVSMTLQHSFMDLINDRDQQLKTKQQDVDLAHERMHRLVLSVRTQLEAVANRFMELKTSSAPMILTEVVLVILGLFVFILINFILGLILNALYEVLLFIKALL